MKVINCFVLSIFLFIAGCGNFEWFPADKTAKFPNLTKTFSTATATIGQAVTLTFTITNASGNPAQSGLAFSDTLPGQTANSTIGMFVASPSAASTTCAAGTISTSGTTSVGDTVLTFSGGAIGAGPATCTVTVQVTSNASTTTLIPSNQSFINGFGNMSNVSSNLNNTVSNQLLAFSPFLATATINSANVTIQARDLVVTTNGTTTSFSLLVDNTSTTNSANVTVTVTGYDSSGAPVLPAVTVPATSVTLAANATGILLTLPGVPVNSAILTWRITGITITAP
jgi:uncharacterized repeat protein (TIGR01451 family)